MFYGGRGDFDVVYAMEDILIGKNLKRIIIRSVGIFIRYCYISGNIQNGEDNECSRKEECQSQ